MDGNGVDYREFAPAHWPDILGLVDDEWVTGELRAWIRSEDGWDGYVQYRSKPGANYLARFPADQIRQEDPPVDDESQRSDES